MVKKYLLTTLGCKVNQYESQQIREVLDALGLRPARLGDVADIAVVNTCAVTVAASRKSRQAIRRLSRQGRTSVVVIGCGAAADAGSIRKTPGVTALLGHDVDISAELRRLLVRRLGLRSTHPIDDAHESAETTRLRRGVNGDEGWMRPGTARPGHDTTTSGSSINIIPASRPAVKRREALTGRITAFAGHQRAFLKVQDGCDAFCSYCIVPRLRPTLKSKPIEIAVAEAQDLVRAGHREIIVTGIFLGAYGRETAVRHRWTSRRSPLAQLVSALAQVDGLTRLRLSSLEPGDVDESLLEVLAAYESCAPHLHLPLQSGSADVLRRMNRQYTRDAFVETIDRVRAALDRPAITTDIIVGFPGETERDFDDSVEIARTACFCKIHAFPFSPRDGTAAARRPQDFVHPKVVRERMRRLSEIERECSLQFRRGFIGETERVIVEGLDGSVASCRKFRRGRADRYFEIHFESDDVHAGDVATLRVDRVTPIRTHGTRVRERVDTCPLRVGSSPSEMSIAT